MARRKIRRRARTTQTTEEIQAHNAEIIASDTGNPGAVLAVARDLIQAVTLANLNDESTDDADRVKLRRSWGRQAVVTLETKGDENMSNVGTTLNGVKLHALTKTACGALRLLCSPSNVSRVPRVCRSLDSSDVTCSRCLNLLRNRLDQLSGMLLDMTVEGNRLSDKALEDLSDVLRENGYDVLMRNG